MPAALLGAVRCSRCGHEQGTARTCESCQARWAPAAVGSVGDAKDGPLAGVARATIGRRRLAQLVDAIVPLACVGVAIALATGALPSSFPWWLAAVAAVVVLAVQAVAVAIRGRSLGRLLLRLRTVDDLTATPVRLGRFTRQLASRGWLRHVATADLRRGRDPIDVRLAQPPLDAAGSTQVETTSTSSTANAATGSASVPGAGAPRRSVGIVLDTGERYEIARSLLLGRSPVDPTGSGDRALLAWPDMTRRLAKTHVLLEWSGTVLWVTDLHSASGTAVVSPAGELQLLAPGVRAPAVIGSTVECGGRSVKVVPSG